MLENNHKRKSLGRGLGALLGDEADFLNPVNGVHEGDEVTVEISCLVPGRYQPRRDFDEEALNALADSVSEKGILQPLLVRSVDNGKYEIIAGERRFRAAEKAGLSSVPVIIKNMDDREVLEVALIENLLRENLSAIEEAEGLKRLMDEFAHTQDALAKVVGKSRSHIANTLRLLTLPPEVRRMIEDKVFGAGRRNCCPRLKRPPGGSFGRPFARARKKIRSARKKRKRRGSGRNIIFHNPKPGHEGENFRLQRRRRQGCFAIFLGGRFGQDY